MVCFLLQELTDKFRLNYCRLWQALMNNDHDSIKQYCGELQAGPLYRLLACMVTARAWANIEAGLTKTTRSSAEVGDMLFNVAACFSVILH